MSATGYTPISLYYSTTAAATPSAGNLANGELAINITDGKLFYKDNLGAVQVLADKSAATPVVSISFGTTGLTPATTTTGAITVAGTLAVANGGTGITSGTSGGVLYYSATGTLASSAALAASSIVVGGGAGAAPTTTTTGSGVVTALGNAANATGGFTTINGTATLTNKRIDPRVSSTTSTSAITPDISAYDQYCLTALATTLTINAPTGTPVDGDKLIFRILDNGSSQTITWNGTYTVIGTTLPTVTTANKTVYVGCIYNANNTRWDVVAVTTQA